MRKGSHFLKLWNMCLRRFTSHLSDSIRGEPWDF
jgi:hypothetical protein